MPEALAVVAVVAIVAIAWIGAWWHGRDPARHKPIEEAARLRRHLAWLETRLEVAERENWSADMVARLDAELDTTLRDLVASEKLAARRE